MKDDKKNAQLWSRFTQSKKKILILMLLRNQDKIYAQLTLQMFLK